jgi:hypothetical protein
MLSGRALLAQSAEHGHGKAGVVGSIPTEGSSIAIASGACSASHLSAFGGLTFARSTGKAGSSEV